MKNKLLVLLLLVCILTSPLFAGPMGQGLALGGLFAGLGAVGLLLGGDDEIVQGLSWTSIGVGGVVAFIGLMVGVAELTAAAEPPPDSPALAANDGMSSQKQKKKDSVFNHIDFATNGTQTYVGVRFSF